MRIGQKAYVEYQVGVGRNAITKSKAHNGNQQRPPPRVLKPVNNELAQLVNVELGRVDDDVSQTSYGSHPSPLQTNPFGYGPILTEGMRTPRFAKPPNQRFIARFHEYQGGWMLGREFAINSRQLFDLLAFSRIHEQSRALHFAHAFHRQFAELRDETDR